MKTINEKLDRVESLLNEDRDAAIYLLIQIIRDLVNEP